MDLLKSGKLIRGLRCEKGLTQKYIADELGICAKTVSKWETGKGFPDVSLISELSDILEIDISKLLVGEMPRVKPDVGNVKRTKFYACKKCGNLLTSTGEAEVICCGRKLNPLVAVEQDNAHIIKADKIENDYYITFKHPMTKEHYISYVSYVWFDRILTVRLYPEQGSEVRIPVMRGGKLYYYCTEHGLFMKKI